MSTETQNYELNISGNGMKILSGLVADIDKLEAGLLKVGKQTDSGTFSEFYKLRDDLEVAIKLSKEFGKTDMASQHNIALVTMKDNLQTIINLGLQEAKLTADRSSNQKQVNLAEKSDSSQKTTALKSRIILQDQLNKSMGVNTKLLNNKDVGERELSRLREQRIALVNIGKNLKINKNIKLSSKGDISEFTSSIKLQQLALAKVNSLQDKINKSIKSNNAEELKSLNLIKKISTARAKVSVSNSTTRDTINPNSGVDLTGSNEYKQISDMLNKRNAIQGQLTTLLNQATASGVSTDDLDNINKKFIEQETRLSKLTPKFNRLVSSYKTLHTEQLKQNGTSVNVTATYNKISRSVEQAAISMQKLKLTSDNLHRTMNSSSVLSSNKALDDTATKIKVINRLYSNYESKLSELKVKLKSLSSALANSSSERARQVILEKINITLKEQQVIMTRLNATKRKATTIAASSRDALAELDSGKWLKNILKRTAAYTSMYSVISRGVQAIKAATAHLAEFDKSSRLIAAVGFTKGSFSERLEKAIPLQAELNALTIRYGDNLQDVNKVAAELARAGISSNELVATTEIVAKLAKLTGDTIAVSSGAMVTYTQVFGEASSATDSFKLSTEQLGDKLAYMANASKLSTQDIATFSNYALASAKAAGASVNALGGLAITFSNTGTSASTAGTNVRKLFQMMNNNSDKVVNFFNSIGVSQAQLRLDMSKDLEQSDAAFVGFVESIASASKESFDKATAGMDVRQREVLTKIRLNSESIIREIEATGSAKDVLNDVDIGISEGTSATWDRFGNLLETINSKALAPFINLATKVVRKLIEFKEVTEYVAMSMTSGIILTMGYLALKSKLALAAIRFIAPALFAEATAAKAAAASTGMFTTAIKALTTAMARNPFFAIATGALIAGAALYTLANSTDDNTEAMKNFESSIKDKSLTELRLIKKTMDAKIKLNDITKDEVDLLKEKSVVIGKIIKQQTPVDTIGAARAAVKSAIKEYTQYKEAIEAPIYQANVNDKTKELGIKNLAELKDNITKAKDVLSNIIGTSTANLDKMLTTAQSKAYSNIGKLSLDIIKAKTYTTTTSVDKMFNNIKTNIIGNKDALSKYIAKISGDDAALLKQNTEIFGNILDDSIPNITEKLNRLHLAQASAENRDGFQSDAYKNMIKLLRTILDYKKNIAAVDKQAAQNLISKSNKNIGNATKLNKKNNDIVNYSNLKNAYEVEIELLTPNQNVVVQDFVEQLQAKLDTVNTKLNVAVNDTTLIDLKEKLTDIQDGTYSDAEAKFKTLGTLQENFNMTGEAQSKERQDKLEAWYKLQIQYQNSLRTVEKERATIAQNFTTQAIKGTDDYDVASANGTKKASIDVLSAQLDATTVASVKKQLQDAISDIQQSLQPIVFKTQIEGFDTTSNQFASMLNSTSALVNTNATYRNSLGIVATQLSNNAKALEKEGTTSKKGLVLLKQKENLTKKQSKLESQNTKDNLAGYAATAGALGDMFNEGSKEAKAFHTLQMTLSAVRMAMQIQELAAFLTAEYAKFTAASTTALATSLQAPYPMNFVSFAAVAAILASLGGGSSVSGVAPSYNEGTGTVFGSDEASNSIENSISVIADAVAPELVYLSSMDRSLKLMTLGISGTANQLSGLDPSTIAGLGWTGAGDTSSSFLGLGGAVGGFMSSSRSTSVVGSGLQFESQKLIDDAVVKAFTDFQTVSKSSFLWHSSSSTSYNTEETAVSETTKNNLDFILGNMVDALDASTNILDTSRTKNIQDATLDIGKVDLNGLDQSEIADKLNNVFSAEFDKVTEQVYGASLDGYRRVGEGLGETMTRVATGMAEYGLAVEQLGFDTISYTMLLNQQGNVGEEAFKQTISAQNSLLGLNVIIRNFTGTVEELSDAYIALTDVATTMDSIGTSAVYLTDMMVKGAGSIDELQSSMNSYLENYFTVGEQASASAGSLMIEFGKLGLQLPKSKEEYRKLMESIKLSSDSGQELYGALLGLNDEFSTYIDQLDEANGMFGQMVTGLVDTVSQLLGLSTGTQREQDLISFNNNRDAIDALLDKDGILTDEEKSTLDELITSVNSSALKLQSDTVGDKDGITGNLVDALMDINSRVEATSDKERDLLIARNEEATIQAAQAIEDSRFAEDAALAQERLLAADAAAQALLLAEAQATASLATTEAVEAAALITIKATAATMSANDAAQYTAGIATEARGIADDAATNAYTQQLLAEASAEAARVAIDSQSANMLTAINISNEASAIAADATETSRLANIAATNRERIASEAELLRLQAGAAANQSAQDTADIARLSANDAMNTAVQLQASADAARAAADISIASQSADMLTAMANAAATQTAADAAMVTAQNANVFATELQAEANVLEQARLNANALLADATVVAAQAAAQAASSSADAVAQAAQISAASQAELTAEIARQQAVETLRLELAASRAELLSTQNAAAEAARLASIESARLQTEAAEAARLAAEQLAVAQLNNTSGGDGDTNTFNYNSGFSTQEDIDWNNDSYFGGDDSSGGYDSQADNGGYGGYDSDFDDDEDDDGWAKGGFTPNIGVNTIAGVVHGGEYVAPMAQVQKYPELFKALDSSRGYRAGGYVGASTTSTTSATMTDSNLDRLIIERLEELIEVNIRHGEETQKVRKLTEENSVDTLYNIVDYGGL